MNRICVFGFLLVAVTAWAEEPSTERTLPISIGPKQTLVFRRVSPAAEQLDYPDFYVQETEVTNAQFKTFLDATGRTKDDSDVLKIIQGREPKFVPNADGNGGTISSGVISTGDVIYSIADETTIWRDGRYPEGLGNHPVALVTLDDATAFADWLNRTHENAGLFRLPTWNEWMVAAYGKTRDYPWGPEWDSRRAHTSYGIPSEFRAGNAGEPDRNPKRTEPVTSRPDGRTPEGIYGLIGNASEYLYGGDPKDDSYFNLGSRSMGGGFTDGRALFLLNKKNERLQPRNDYWGYSHHTTNREDNVGFRLVLDPTKNADLVKRRPLFKQINEAWMTEDEDEAPEDTPAAPPMAPKQ